jgi:hypothetical protein
MKIRLDHESLRLRLTKKEVHAFAETQYLDEPIALTPGRSLVFALEEKAAGEPELKFEGDQIRILIARVASAEMRIQSLRAGIHFKNALDISIEEDFHS